MEKTIVIDSSVCTEIERLQYECESRKDLISYMIANDFATKGERFNEYQKEYLEFFAQYNKAKQEMIDTYAPNAKTWNLKFNTKELTYED